MTLDLWRAAHAGFRVVPSEDTCFRIHTDIHAYWVYCYISTSSDERWTDNHKIEDKSQWMFGLLLQQFFNS